MTKEEQEKFFDEFTAKMKSVMIGKSDDYGTKDRLSAFKNVGTICGSGNDGLIACLHLIGTKVARLSSLLGDGKKPKNEAIKDSILDLANYSVLLAMLEHDKGQKQHEVLNEDKTDEQIMYWAKELEYQSLSANILFENAKWLVRHLKNYE